MTVHVSLSDNHQMRKNLATGERLRCRYVVVICTHQSVLPYNDACIPSLPLIIHFTATPNQLVLGHSKKEPCTA